MYPTYSQVYICEGCLQAAPHLFQLSGKWYCWTCYKMHKEKKGEKV